MTEPIRDLVHIGHAELLTPFPDESLRFFVDLFGMEIEAQEGQSVFLRGWGDYARYSLKLTESELPGMGHMAIRAWSQEALERRAKALEEAGCGIGWIDGDLGHGAAVKRLDHVNLLAKDVEPNRRFAEDLLGYRLYEAIRLNDGTESGAWMSLSIMAHELIYVADHAGMNGRLHHFAFWVDTREEMLRAADFFLDHDVPIEQSPSKHAVAQGFFLYVYEPGGNRVEVTSGGYLQYDPTPEPVVWTEAERARGQAWGVRTVESFHTYGTPPASGEASGPPIPPTSKVPDL